MDSYLFRRLNPGVTFEGFTITWVTLAEKIFINQRMVENTEDFFFLVFISKLNSHDRDGNQRALTHIETHTH